MEKILQAAVDSYNKWVSAEKFYEGPNVKELRGVFYNKLLTEIRNDLSDSYIQLIKSRILDIIKCEDIECKFLKTAFLVQVRFGVISERYSNPDRVSCMVRLNEAAVSLTYNYYSDPRYYDIADIVKRTENYII